MSKLVRHKKGSPEAKYNYETTNGQRISLDIKSFFRLEISRGLIILNLLLSQHLYSTRKIKATISNQTSQLLKNR